ncbi:MAG TPA: hypothetical protein VN429_10440 [Methanospirillum sp.]|uniref:hypothetical protein n=1 Tax=Methanospirillum sp. TaxID=45200 RepID=UPI002B6793C2|nr:hypothetical protein [Methanospirillum sp.]HWQ64823.1 hypothetical protein [Methanospirillum sp.]
MEEYLIAVDLDNLTAINHTARVTKQSEEKEFLSHVRQSSSNPHRIVITRYTHEGATSAPLEEA